MKKDQEKWDEKYRSISYQREVAAILKSYSGIIPKFGKGLRVLDIACGKGQNSLFLANKGYEVDAMDISHTALEDFDHPNISKHHVDFDLFRPQDSHYDIILNFYFLERRLFPYMISSLKKGGWLLFETYLESKESLSNPDHKLRPQELLHSFLPLNIELYQETDETATLVARKK